MKNFLIYFFLSLLIPSTFIFAGGSSYSRYGIGDIFYPSSGDQEGSACVSIAELHSWSINRINPAGLTALRYTRLSGGLTYSIMSSKDASSSSVSSNGNFAGFYIAAPILSAYGIGISGGLAPYSITNYNISTEVQNAGIPYDITYKGEGGLSKGAFSLSVRPLNALSLGFSYNYLFGDIRTDWQMSSTDADFYPSEVTRSTETRGSFFTIGGIFSGLPSLIGLNDSTILTIGAVFSTASDLSTTRRVIYSTSMDYDTTAGIKGTLRIPLAFGIGISYNVNKRLISAADIYFQQWKNFSIDNTTSNEIRNSTRYAVGIEYLPLYGPDVHGLDRLEFRAGVAYTQTYYIIQGEPINEFSATAGIGIPILYDTRLNLAFEFTTRGKVTQTPIQLVKENLFQIHASLSLGELWFVQSEDE